MTTGIAFLVAYIALEWVSFIHEYKGLPVTPWNPGLGVVFALMLYSGARYGVVLFVGVLVAEIAVLRTNLPWPFIIGVATIIAAGYSAVAFVVRRKLDVGLNHLRDVLLLLAAGAAGALLVALFLSLLLIADEKLSLADVFVASGPLLVGDAIGIAVMTPLVLRFILHIPHISLQTLRAFAPEVALYVAVVLLFLWFIGLTESESGFKLFYLFFLPVVVAAIRYGLDGACLGLALTQLGLVGAAASARLRRQCVHRIPDPDAGADRDRADRRRDRQRAPAGRPRGPRGRGAAPQQGSGSRPSRALQPRQQHGLGAGARNQPADHGRPRARPRRAAPSAQRQRQPCRASTTTSPP